MYLSFISSGHCIKDKKINFVITFKHLFLYIESAQLYSAFIMGLFNYLMRIKQKFKKKLIFAPPTLILRMCSSAENQAEYKK